MLFTNSSTYCEPNTELFTNFIQINKNLSQMNFEHT